MEEADLEMTKMAMGDPVARRGEHIVRFYLEAIQDSAESLKAGRPIHKEVEFIEIRIPGDNSNVLVREATDYDKNFFASAYQLWKQKGEEAVDGTPLEAWPLLNKAQVMDLKHFHIKTVENLAEMSDSRLQGNLPFRKLRDQAKLFLAAANDLAPMTDLQNKIEQKDNEIASLQQMIEKLQHRIEKLEDA